MSYIQRCFDLLYSDKGRFPCCRRDKKFYNLFKDVKTICEEEDFPIPPYYLNRLFLRIGILCNITKDENSYIKYRNIYYNLSKNISYKKILNAYGLIYNNLYETFDCQEFLQEEYIYEFMNACHLSYEWDIFQVLDFDFNNLIIKI
jgi:hypothetical protein